MFNIVSFGERFEKLFPASVPFASGSFQRASQVVGEFQANLGGTDLLAPLGDVLKAAPHPNFPRQVVVMTDGDVANTDAVIELVRSVTARTPTRVFAMGIGMDASQTLIRGVAKAGHGSFEFVHGDMRIEPSVARIVQRVLRPVITRCVVEWSPELAPLYTTPALFPTVFSGQKITAMALLGANDGKVHTVSLRLQLSGGIERRYVAQVDLATAQAGQLVHRLAAQSLVADVVSKASPVREADAVALAVRYGIASKLTSLVAIYEDSGAVFGTAAPVQVDGNQDALDSKPAPALQVPADGPVASLSGGALRGKAGHYAVHAGRGSASPAVNYAVHALPVAADAAALSSPPPHGGYAGGYAAGDYDDGLDASSGSSEEDRGAAPYFEAQLQPQPQQQQQQQAQVQLRDGKFN
jgi:hypothetical protein